jgi:hypothetical protein
MVRRGKFGNIQLIRKVLVSLTINRETKLRHEHGVSECVPQVE